MRKLASIQRVKSVDSIEGADRIELVHVLGWQCVAKKNQFKAGDQCVYFEIDSFLPMYPEFEFLRSSSYKNSELFGEGYRLRTQKFRGQISQGLVMTIEELSKYLIRYKGEILLDGENVTDRLKVQEYVPPELATGDGTTIGEANKYIHITDETRIQSAPELLHEFKGHPYYITTKMDGASHSICIAEDGSFHVFGHNYEYKDDGTSAFYEYVKKNNLKGKLEKFLDGENDSLSDEGYEFKSITVQGEWCGEKIQGNRLKLKKPEWYVFTVDFNGERQNMDTTRHCAEYLEVPSVPLEETGVDLTLKYPDEESLLKRAGENRCHAYPGACEGIVIRPMEPVYSKTLDGPLSMKVINNKYLLKHKE